VAEEILADARHARARPACLRIEEKIDSRLSLFTALLLSREALRAGKNAMLRPFFRTEMSRTTLFEFNDLPPVGAGFGVLNRAVLRMASII
jgi:hypothetical protein